MSIARAIVHQPALLLADEPTGNLDPMLAAGHHAIIYSDQRESGVSTFIASHDLSLLARMPYRLFNLQKGRLT